jgi:hypothetical protein
LGAAGYAFFAFFTPPGGLQPLKQAHIRPAHPAGTKFTHMFYIPGGKFFGKFHTLIAFAANPSHLA